MKKLIAISVMCVLVLGAAFAETTVGGKIHIGGQILNGDNVEGSAMGTAEMAPDWYNTAVAVNFGDAKAGGKLSIHNNSPSFYDYYVWWRPTDMFRMQVGVNADGNFGTAQITGWGFTGEAKNKLGAINEYSGPVFGLAHSRRGFYEGTGETNNVAFSFFPLEGLTINLWIPLKGDNNAMKTFAKTELNVVYRIEEIGNVTLSFQGNTGYIKPNADDAWVGADGVTETTASPKLFLSFYLTAIENMGIDLGLAYKLPFTAYQVKDEDDKLVYAGKDEDGAIQTTTNHPFEIGLGYRVSAGDLTFKLRAAVSLGGSTVVDTADPVNDPLQLSVNILPSYKVGKSTLFLYGGIGIQAIEDWEKEKGGIFANSGSNTVVSWFINPYIHVPAGDSLRFQVGFQVYSDGVLYPYYEGGTRKYDPAKISWAIPFGFYTYF